MTITLSQEERASDHYQILTGAGSLREFFTVAASILGDLCDEAAASSVLDVERFPTYGAFCRWTHDFQVSESIQESWSYYWNEAASVFEVYEKLPQMTDWALREEVEVFDFFYLEIPGVYQDFFDRSPIIETCIALSRWIRGKNPNIVVPDITP
jgi:hypothetical protein